MDTNKLEINDMDYFKDEEDKIKNWMIQEVYFFDPIKKVALFNRANSEQEYFSVLSLNTKRINFDETQNPDFY
jgi:hypothetical protein